MHYELVEAIKNQGYWYKLQDNILCLNIEDPESPVESGELADVLSAMLRITITETSLQARWMNCDSGYDERWDFESVPSFMTFLETFIEEGIDAV